MPIVAAVAVPHPPIILPEVGKGEEAKIEKTARAYHSAMALVAGCKPETVVIASPHAPLYADAFQIAPGEGAMGDFARFGAPRAEIEAVYDTTLATEILALAQEQGLAAVSQPRQEAQLDHGTMIPLGFLQQAGFAGRVVSVGLSGLSAEEHYRLGRCIAAAAGEKPVAFIASGDLSHKLKADGPYGFVPEGPVLDEAITGALQKADFEALLDIDPALADAGAECGLRAFVMMAGALDGLAVQAELLSYEDTFGVGYAVATFLPQGPDEKRRFLARAEAKRRQRMIERQNAEDAYVSLARYALETWLSGAGRAGLPGGIPTEMLQEKAGVFVTLYKEGQLRGCIGTTAPTCPNVAQEILQNTISSAAEDPRFEPVRKEEADFIEIKVDVLGAPEAVESEAELDAKRYGVIVSAGGRRGLLLPDLDGVDTVAQQVAIAKNKAGIPQSTPVRLQRFTVTRHV